MKALTSTFLHQIFHIIGYMAHMCLSSNTKKNNQIIFPNKKAIEIAIKRDLYRSFMSILINTVSNIFIRQFSQINQIFSNFQSSYAANISQQLVFFLTGPQQICPIISTNVKLEVVSGWGRWAMWG